MNQLQSSQSDLDSFKERLLYETLSIRSENELLENSIGVDYCTIRSPNDLDSLQPIYDAVQPPSEAAEYENLAQKDEVFVEPKKSIKPNFLRVKNKYKVKGHQDCF